MTRLGRDLKDVIIIDVGVLFLTTQNSPASYFFQPENSFPCVSWYDNMNDRELYDMIPILQHLATVPFKL